MPKKYKFVKPLVTIALPVYNGASTLKLAICSILKQSFQDWEMIILDDASTDDSLEVMCSLHDPRIHLVKGDENIGLAARLNMAVDLARGDFFVRMDQDDVSFPMRIEKQLDFLQLHPEVDLVATNYAVFNSDHAWLGKLAVHERHDDICRKPWSGFYMAHPTWMGKLEWFKRYRYKSYADGAEDQDLLLRSYIGSHFACMDEVLLAYRQDSRRLKKVLRARSKYVKAAFLFYGLSGGDYIFIRVLLTQVVKGCGDAFNLFFGTSELQRPLLPLLRDERLSLQGLFDDLEKTV